MRIFRRLFLLCVITIAALIYVHQNIELIKLSYAIDSKEKRLSVLLDQKEKLIYNLNNITSPSQLERVLVTKHVDVEYPHKEQVIRVAMRRAVNSHGPVQYASVSRTSVVNTMLDFIGMGPEAHAKER